MPILKNKVKEAAIEIGKDRVNDAMEGTAFGLEDKFYIWLGLMSNSDFTEMGLECPPCFTLDDWYPWKYYASGCQKKGAHYCEDCTPEYKRKMIIEKRCVHKETVFYWHVTREREKIKKANKDYQICPTCHATFSIQQSACPVCGYERKIISVYGEIKGKPHVEWEDLNSWIRSVEKYENDGLIVNSMKTANQVLESYLEKNNIPLNLLRNAD
jgi:hypothetical protein